jgi:hypothetical protein
VQVSGLEGLTQPVPVQLENHSPSTVNLSGGNTQNIIIQPGQVQTGGTFVSTGGVTGIQSGGFVITGTIPSAIDASTNTSTAPSPPSGTGHIEIEMAQLTVTSGGPVAVPVPVPGPAPKPAPVPKPSPCACDVVNMFVSDGNNGVNKVKVTDDSYDEDRMHLQLALTVVDHEIKCKGATPPEKCSATVDWEVHPQFTFKFSAKDPRTGKMSTKEESAGKKESTTTNPKYESRTKDFPRRIDLEGSCDPKATATTPLPYYTVSQIFEVTYPEQLAKAIEDAKKEKPRGKVTIERITATIQWSAIAKDCKTVFLEGSKKIDHGGTLVREFHLDKKFEIPKP